MAGGFDLEGVQRVGLGGGEALHLGDGRRGEGCHRGSGRGWRWRRALITSSRRALTLAVLLIWLLLRFLLLPCAGGVWPVGPAQGPPPLVLRHQLPLLSCPHDRIVRHWHSSRNRPANRVPHPPTPLPAGRGGYGGMAMLSGVVNIAAFSFCVGGTLLSNAEFKPCAGERQRDIAGYGWQKR